MTEDEGGHFKEVDRVQVRNRPGVSCLRTSLFFSHYMLSGPSRERRDIDQGDQEQRGC